MKKIVLLILSIISLSSSQLFSMSEYLEILDQSNNDINAAALRILLQYNICDEEYNICDQEYKDFFEQHKKRIELKSIVEFYKIIKKRTNDALEEKLALNSNQILMDVLMDFLRMRRKWKKEEDQIKNVVHMFINAGADLNYKKEYHRFCGLYTLLDWALVLNLDCVIHILSYNKAPFSNYKLLIKNLRKNFNTDYIKPAILNILSNEPDSPIKDYLIETVTKDKNCDDEFAITAMEILNQEEQKFLELAKTLALLRLKVAAAKRPHQNS